MCYKEFIADHVTFSQLGGGFIVAVSFQTFEHLREPLLCEWLEKAIVLYKYHHSTKLYRKTSQVCCRLYCYECTARVTMPTATNE